MTDARLAADHAESTIGGRRPSAKSVWGVLGAGIVVSLLGAAVYSGGVVEVVEDLRRAAEESFMAGEVTMSARLDGPDRWHAALSLALTWGIVVGIVWLGKCGDRWGRRRPYLIALGLAAVGLLIGAAAPGPAVLAAAGAVLGLGVGSLLALSQAIIADLVPGARRGVHLGALGAVTAVFTLVGGPVGSHAVVGLGRHGALIVAALAFAAVTAFAWWKLCVPTWRPERRFDWWGGALFTLLSSGVVVMTAWRYVGVEVRVGVVVGTVVLLAAFVVAELRTTAPLLPLRLFRDGTFTIATLVALVIGLVSGWGVGRLANVLAFGHSEAAETTSTMIAAATWLPYAVGALAAGAAISRAGRYRAVSISGLLTVLAGVVSLTRVTTETPTAVFAVSAALLGLGTALASQAVVYALISRVDAREVGIAAAVNGDAISIGSVVGAALHFAIFSGRIAELVDGAVQNSTGVEWSGGPDVAVAVAEAAAGSWLPLVPVAVVGLVLALFLRRGAVAAEEPDVIDGVSRE